MLPLEIVVLLGVWFAFLAYAMVRTQMTKGWVLWPSSVDKPSGEGQ